MNYIKSLSAILILSFLLMSCGPDFEGTFSHKPEKPQAGEEITVMYDPTGTALESTEQVDLVAYVYSVDLDDAVGVEMKKEGKGFVGSFSTLPNSRGVVVKFVERSDYDNSDSNDKQGYLISLYDEKGEVLASSRAGLAAGYYFWGPSAGLERNGEKAVAEFNKAFADNTEIKSDYLESYFNVLLRVKPSEADSIIENELVELEKKTNLSETELGLLSKWFSKVDLADKAESYSQTTLEKFPEGEFAQLTAMQEFNNAQSGDEKAAALENFIEQFPESEMLDNMYNNIVYAYYQEGNYEKAYNFLKANPQTVHPVYYQRIVSKMINENADLNLAMMIAEEGVQQASLNLENPYTEKSNRETVKEWKNSRAYYLGLNQYAYGELLHKTGSLAKVVDVLEKAIKNTDKLYSQQDLKEFYAGVLVEAEEYEKALEEISAFIEEGNGSTPLKENLKTAYVAVNGSDDDFEGYLNRFVSTAEAEMINELKSKMINEPAPTFTLTDLEGNQVSLEDFKGKTVVIDFWATWCGPCLKSFPALKTAVEKFENDESVEFLFINTWERVENKEENARNFINENNYPFHVALDLNNEVITKFKVEGIPTKFVVGPDQNIKFKSVGFGGNAEQMVKELEVMIQLAK